MSSCKASPILLIYSAGDAAADYGGSEGEQLRVRSEESLGQMLLGNVTRVVQDCMRALKGAEIAP